MNHSIAENFMRSAKAPQNSARPGIVIISTSAVEVSIQAVSPLSSLGAAAAAAAAGAAVSAAVWASAEAPVARLPSTAARAARDGARRGARRGDGDGLKRI